MLELKLSTQLQRVGMKLLFVGHLEFLRIECRGVVCVGWKIGSQHDVILLPDLTLPAYVATDLKHAHIKKLFVYVIVSNQHVAFQPCCRQVK